MTGDQRAPGGAVTEEGGKRKGLGRGLSALLEDESEGFHRLERTRSNLEVPIETLRPGRFQPRRRFDPQDSAALVASIRERGILQPILVRRAPTPESAEAYEIVAGERRWRAAQEARLHRVPVVVKELSDTEALEVALVENLQREDLTPLEEAEGYRRMIEEFGHTQERLARAVGRSRSHLTNMLRLLTLPDAVKAMVDDGRLSAGHARTLVGSEQALALAKRIVARGLSVRQTERLTQGSSAAATAPPPARKSADTLALETDISRALGLPVTIHHKGADGHVRISYRSLEQLDEICRRLAHR